MKICYTAQKASTHTSLCNLKDVCKWKAQHFCIAGVESALAPSSPHPRRYLSPARPPSRHLDAEAEAPGAPHFPLYMSGGPVTCYLKKAQLRLDPFPSYRRLLRKPQLSHGCITFFPSRLRGLEMKIFCLLCMAGECGGVGVLQILQL